MNKFREILETKTATWVGIATLCTIIVVGHFITK